MYHFSSEIIFGQLLQTFGDFYLVTLHPIKTLACLISIKRDVFLTRMTSTKLAEQHLLKDNKIFFCF